ncbi:hypothetical protein AAFN85_02905 [Mucilaginibacter sp. CAU 1740]|uniref:hypothetical protein n=1 Tax=Mucilaginibacter sp. CAU 1740 TaxID=3140365 RepID=UPI00325B637E
MSKSVNDEKTYPFFWLDELLEVTLNPAKTNIKTLSPELQESIKDRLLVEIDRVSACMKTQAFCLYCSEQLKVVAGHYDQALRLLQRQAASNLAAYPKTGPLRVLGTLIRQSLDELAQSVQARYQTYLPEKVEPVADRNPSEQNFFDKVLCALSADQLGIVLKSAFDVKLILGKSFRKVCKAVAPFLSTPWKADISWDTIRSIAGRAEPRDKEIVIEFLEKMILKIKDN